eukprot:4987637-Amphidinium_carterae.1
MSQTFCNWCDRNTFTSVLNKYLEADGTIKQQYVVADNGVDHDHKQEMSLHRWHRDDHMVLTSQARVSADDSEGEQWREWHRPTGLQWTSPVTI